MVDHPDVIGVLSSHINDIKDELQAVRQERDRAKAELHLAREERASAILKLTTVESRIEALQAAIDVERTMVEAERGRTKEMIADRDRWADQAA